MAATNRELVVNAAGTTPLNVPMYPADLDALDAMVAELKQRSRLWKRPSRAKLIRLALRQLLSLSTEDIEALLEKWKL